MNTQKNSSECASPAGHVTENIISGPAALLLLLSDVTAFVVIIMRPE